MTKEEIMEYRQKINDKAYMDMAINEIVMRGIEIGSLDKHRKDTSRNKMVRCIETGILYESASSASRASGLSVACVSLAIRYKRKAGGYRWEYIQEGLS